MAGTTRRCDAWLIAVAIAFVGGSPAWAQRESPPRTFPQFVGTWILDEAASTGRLRMAPPPSRRLTIATTPTQITVTKVLRLEPPRPGFEAYRRATEDPFDEIYRFDGAETTRDDGLSRHTFTFTLVADALALTIKQSGRNSGGAFTVVTDAYSVEADVLTDRQLSSVTASGQILTMQEPTNNYRHTFIYRRAPASIAQ